jgi:hypothetical protein
MPERLVLRVRDVSNNGCKNRKRIFEIMNNEPNIRQNLRDDVGYSRRSVDIRQLGPCLELEVLTGYRDV